MSFTKQDRCDRCGAQAKARSELLGFELLWCMHHFNEHKETLAIGGWNTTIDEEVSALT